MTELTPCPRCNSWQAFRPKQRTLETLPWKEIYIRCLACGYELVLGNTTDEIEMLRMRTIKLRQRMNYEMSRHGTPAQSTVNRAIEVARQMRFAVIKLEEDLEAINGQR